MCKGWWLLSACGERQTKKNVRKRGRETEAGREGRVLERGEFEGERKRRKTETGRERWRRIRRKEASLKEKERGGRV